jgi:Flp pilus assembly protein TadG
MRKLNQKGSLLVMLTLAFALLGTFIGFALDFGRAYLEKARVSRLIDAAALAAAKVLEGQSSFESDATRAACDSLQMNGVPMVMSSATTCSPTAGAPPMTAAVSFFDAPVPGGPPLRHIRITGTEPVPTTFLRFLSWMVPGDYSSLNVVSQAEAGPERPVDLMLVLDRSGSMESTDGTGTKKIAALKTAVTAFLGLSNTFSVDDRIGMVSFAYRGCGNASGLDSTAAACVPDAALDFATSGYISTLQSKVNALSDNGGVGGTNTMEALRTARSPLAAAYADPSRATTRKAVLLVTDGQPTYMRRDSATECQQNPKTGSTMPAPGNINGPAGGCVLGAATWDSATARPYIRRRNLALTTVDDIPPTSPLPNGNLFRDLIGCTRSISGCVTNGAMYEANQIRNCGYNNSACNGGGAEHDIVFFSIAIGKNEASTSPQNSLDANAKCMLARMANANEILNAATGVVETMTTVCNSVFTTTVDGDTHADLTQSWPCGSGPCIDTTQEKGKVYIVDLNGNVSQQLSLIFQEIAWILKLRLVT